ncbi:glutamate-5-semialdehyde dehydrogenase [Chytriomyces confervae]|uniref:Glutamate-5-semialdehyde dehydrogenase n=1 Tax=Chytriomyces confervae TaxID=246404 RepID=A0A507DC27_9FUNG|nr:glutamate-5-semialdehyde dehydrogenase [Chytriomyces confervae]
MSDMEALAIRSRAASLSLQTASCKDRNAALSLIHKVLLENADKIQQENKADIEAATKLAESGALSQQLVKRLGLSGSKFADMVQGVKDIEMMDDPVGKTTLATRLDDGLDLYKLSCPIGVVLIIFEARPEVVVNIAALALKSGNAVILKGGKEAAKSNAILTSIINDALSQSKTISKDAVLLVESRTAIDELLKLDRYIDLVIPRESNALVCHVQGSTRIPVLGHADGICATYLDEKLDPEMAIRVLIDAKKRKQSDTSMISKATAQDFDTEFLDTILAVKTVPNVSAAIAHINSHGSHHTDAIISSSKENAESCMRSVDSADMFWN